MVSEFLNNRRVFESEWMLDERYDLKTKSMVDNLVDRLVLVIKVADANGAMELDAIERMVVKAFRAAEYKYYGLSKEQLKMVVEMEKRNAEGRK
mgnify:CR=1 FL=1